MRFKGWAVIHVPPHGPIWWTAGNFRQVANDLRRNYPKSEVRVIRVSVAEIKRRKKSK